MDLDLLAKRANKEQDKLIAIVLPRLDHASTSLREHLQYGLGHKKFNSKDFLRQYLAPNLSDLMLAAHIAGIKFSTKLAPRQSSIEASLELSILSSAVAFLSRMKMNLQKLREKYKTTAFEAVTDAGKNINNELLETVKRLVSEGAHIREAKEVLADKFDKLGIRPASKGQFETIYRTQTQIAFAAGKYQAETQNDYIYRELWGYKYVTVEDSRVRPTHAILDGICLPKDHPFWTIFYPPNGFNCRCQAIPLFEEHEIKLPPKNYNGHPIAPDVGFNWKAGTIFNALAS